MADPILRTVKEFCEVYRISRRQMYRLIADGKLEAVKVGSGTRILEDSARRWLSTLSRFPKNRSTSSISRAVANHTPLQPPELSAGTHEKTHVFDPA